MNILDLVSLNFNAPRATCLVQSRLDLDIQIVTFLKSAIKLEQTDFGAHTRLSKKRHRRNWILNGVGRLDGVSDLEVQHAINLDFDIVGSNCSLLGNFVDLLFERVRVCHCFDDRQLKTQT